jgi:predicted acyltransferase (DUF342 family)
MKTTRTWSIIVLGLAAMLLPNLGAYAQLTEVDKIEASDKATSDLFGTSVAISGDRAIVGARGEDDPGAGSGAAYVFEFEPTLPHEFLFLAEEDIEIKGNEASEGDIHSNEKITFKEGEDDPAVHKGDLTAVEEIGIAEDNKIEGDVTSGDDVDVDDDAEVTGTVTADASVAKVALPDPSFTAGGAKVTVGKGDTESLAPGSFGNVKVKKEGTLILSAGEYFFKSLTLRKKATLELDVSGGEIKVNVVKKLTIGKKVTFDLDETKTAFFTLTTLQDKKFKIGKEARILGTIIAADAHVFLDDEVSFKGAICAEKITVDKEVVFLHHSSTTSLPKAAPRYEEDAKEDVRLTSVPSDFELSQNYPNPFNPSTTITFALPNAGDVSLKVYNLRGQLVATLHQGAMAAGRHQILWDGKDARGQQVATGVYVYRLEADGFVATKKLTLMK